MIPREHSPDRRFIAVATTATSVPSSFSSSTSSISFPFTLLRTLCRSPESQRLCFQANPNSFAKIPGVGVSVIFQHVVPCKNAFSFRLNLRTCWRAKAWQNAKPPEIHQDARLASGAARSCPVRQNVPITRLPPSLHSRREQRPETPQVSPHSIHQGQNHASYIYQPY